MPSGQLRKLLQPPDTRALILSQAGQAALGAGRWGQQGRQLQGLPAGGG